MFRRFVIISIIFLSGVGTVTAQQLKKANGKVRGKSYSYYIMHPSQPVKGIVLLMPSRGEEPKKLFWHTSIPRHLAAQGFITVVPRVDYALILEEETKNILDHLNSHRKRQGGIANLTSIDRRVLVRWSHCRAPC